MKTNNSAILPVMRLALRVAARKHGRMEKMQISLISVVQRNGIMVARAKALAPFVGAEIWIKVEFRPVCAETVVGSS